MVDCATGVAAVVCKSVGARLGAGLDSTGAEMLPIRTGGTITVAGILATSTSVNAAVGYEAGSVCRRDP